MKLSEVRCPRSIVKMAAAFPGEHSVEELCGSYEIDFDTPLYKDRECEEAIVGAICESCGHRFKVHIHFVVDKVEG